MKIRMKIKRILASTIVTSLFSGLISVGSLYSQVESTPLEPNTEIPDRLGAFIGLGPVFQAGSLLGACDRKFSGGIGQELYIAPYYETALSKKLYVGARLTFTYSWMTLAYRQYEPLSVQIPTDGSILTQNVLMRHQADMSLLQAGVMPFIHWTPIKALSFHVGVWPRFVVSSSFKQTAELQQRTVTLPNGEIFDIGYENANGGATTTVQEGKVPSVASLLFDGVFAVSGRIIASKKIVLLPSVQYSLPLINTTSAGEGMKMNSLQFLLGIEYTFGETGKQNTPAKKRY